jgi:hypothetical protein
MKNESDQSNGWLSMKSAPIEVYPIQHVQGKLADGTTVEDMHFAKDLSGEDQPPFNGWFVPFRSGHGYYEVTPVAWKPQEANKTTTKRKTQ